MIPFVWIGGVVISVKSYYTKYDYVRNELERRIDSGEFSTDGRIPSENELSRAYSVSVITARKALSELVVAGRIVRIKGKGSFVAGAVAQQNTTPSGKGIVSLLLLSYDEDDSQFASIVGGVHHFLAQNGYTMTIECSNRNLAMEGEIIARCIRDKISGMILFSTDPEGSIENLIRLEQAGIPFVMLDRMPLSLPVTTVSSYHFDGMYRIARHLTALGHRRIIFFSEEIDTNVHRERMHGFQTALERRGAPFLPALCLTGNYPQLHLLDALIAEHGATAVACINDHAALSVIDHLRARGYDIPGDISVTGFDDSERSRYSDLTTVRQQFREIGRLGAQRLLERIDGTSGHSCSQLAVELIVRGSTGAANTKEDT